jgi:DNA-binding NtrC family response regulator
VRELRNVLARLTVRNQRAITAQSLRDDESEPKTSTIFPRNLLARDSFVSLRDQLERDYLVHHLRRLGGNTAALCKFLGVGRRQLYRRCSRLGIALRDAIGPSGGA